MIDDHLTALLEIKKILTPEQFAGFMALEKAEELMRHHPKWHEGQGDRTKDDESSEHEG